jgi:hypothetical protein
MKPQIDLILRYIKSRLLLLLLLLFSVSLLCQFLNACVFIAAQHETKIVDRPAKTCHA